MGAFATSVKLGGYGDIGRIGARRGSGSPDFGGRFDAGVNAPSIGGKGAPGGFTLFVKIWVRQPD